MRAAGGNHATIRRYVDEVWRIPTGHFDPVAARSRGRKPSIPLEDVLVAKSRYSRSQLKKRLYKEGLKPRRCELCSQDECWRGRRMALILDHINGIADDNRLENLRIVCPNCAATLETHCRRADRVVRDPLACARCGEEFVPRFAAQRYCSQACGTRHGRGIPRPEARKVPRPPYARLLREVNAIGFLATGRRYGVSDNAVRKWIHWYETELAAKAAASPQG